MFDIGFFELVLIFIIALVVIGPARLPGVARNVGLWTGRLKRRFLDAKASFEAEIGADEVRRQLHNEAVLKELGEIPREMANLTPKEPAAGEAPDKPGKAQPASADKDSPE